MYSDDTCSIARKSRDTRFDGLFFVAVKTTGIYCRPICPAPCAKEENVSYFQYAHQAAQAGFRPCLRCRPDSSPNSYPWLGAKTTALRAKKLIDEGVYTQLTSEQFVARLGISHSYLNQLFKRHFGISPSQYALFVQCQFAKGLLQQTQLPVTEVAYAAGFNSVRRFNDAFKKCQQLTPTQIRKKGEPSSKITLFMSFRPPYNWAVLHNFLAKRLIAPMEWLGDKSYGRTFTYGEAAGQFTAYYKKKKQGFTVEITLNNMRYLLPVVANIKRILDLDADTTVINQHLKNLLPAPFPLVEGLRLAGIWQPFEAGIRAILGQQVSVTAARNLLIKLVEQLGQPVTGKCAAGKEHLRYFPTPCAIANSNLAFFNMPQSRKNALIALAQHYQKQNGLDDPNIDQWLAIKGIGSWTVNYAKMRGNSNPDIYLGGDLGIKKAVQKFTHADFNLNTLEKAAPFRSYLTFQLWQQL